MCVSPVSLPKNAFQCLLPFSLTYPYHALNGHETSNQFCLPLGLRLYPSCSTPTVFSPFSTVLLQVLFARPAGRLPFGCCSIATAQSLFFRFLSTCPVQLQQCLLISPLIPFVPQLTLVFWFVILLCGHLPSSYLFRHVFMYSYLVHVFIYSRLHIHTVVPVLQLSFENLIFVLFCGWFCLFSTSWVGCRLLLMPSSVCSLH